MIRGMAARRAFSSSSAARAGLELGHEILGNGIDHDNPLGRHADLALIEIGAESGGLGGGIEVGIFQHDDRGLTGKLHQARFEMARRDLGHASADARRAGEIDPPHRGMGHEGFDNRLSGFRRMQDRSDCPGRQARVAEDIDDERVQLGAKFRALEHHRITAGERPDDRPDREGDWGVPWRDGKNHAHRLAQAG